MTELDHLAITPEQWRKRGEEMRRLADETKYPDMKEQLLNLAVAYERLAQRAERASGTTLPTSDEPAKVK